MSTSAVNSDINSGVYDAINAASQKSGAASKNKNTALESSGEAQDRFLKLLTTQLQNQDPLNPLDNAQMTSQLAQISTVDGITRLNETVQALLGQSSDNQTLQAAAMIGRTVLAPGNHLVLLEGKSIGAVDLAGAADEVTVTFKDANGLPVHSMKLGPLEQGVSNFIWDGTTDSGAIAADGEYTVSFAAEQGDKRVDAVALEYGAVTSVAKNSQGLTLTVGNHDVVASLADVKQIL